MIWSVKFDKKFIFSPTKEIELRNVHITYTGKLLILAKVKNVFFSRYFPPNDNSFCFHARKVYTNYKFHSLYLEWSSSKKKRMHFAFQVVACAKIIHPMIFALFCGFQCVSIQCLNLCNLWLFVPYIFMRCLVAFFIIIIIIYHVNKVISCID